MLSTKQEIEEKLLRAMKDLSSCEVLIMLTTDTPKGAEKKQEYKSAANELAQYRKGIKKILNKHFDKLAK